MAKQEGVTKKRSRFSFNLPSSGGMRVKPLDYGSAALVHDGEHVSCNLCGSDDSEEIIKISKYGVGFRVVRCKRCGLAYINPRLPANKIECMYSLPEMMQMGFPVSSCGPLATNETWHMARLKVMEKHYKEVNPSFRAGRKLRYIDVGCGFGHTLDYAKKMGWDTYGLDISSHAVEEGRRQGRNLFHTNLESAPFEDDYFDIMLMSEVIEHLTDPYHELMIAMKKLRAGGLLVVDTINIDSFFMRFLGENSPFLEAGHITYFSYKTLGEMLKKADFTVVKGYRGLEIGLGDYIKIYSQVGMSPFAFGMEMLMSVLRKVGAGNFCFGGISYYAHK